MKYVEAGYSQHAGDQGPLRPEARLKEEELWTDQESEEWDKSDRFAQRIGSTQPETKARYGENQLDNDIELLAATTDVTLCGWWHEW